MSYWKWDKKIPKELCNVLIEEVERDGYLTPAGVGVGVYQEHMRNNKTFFLDFNHWFEGIMYNHIRYANSSLNLNYDINGCEPLQYTHYKNNEKYEWHVDQELNDLSRPHQYRKLSAVCQLSDSKDFTGGGLYIKGIDQSVLTEQGDIVVFPSYLEHKAEVVTSGNRITLVCWATGTPFK